MSNLSVVIGCLLRFCYACYVKIITVNKAVLKPGEMTVQKDRIVFYDPEHIEIYSRLSDELTGRKEESGR